MRLDRLLASLAQPPLAIHTGSETDHELGTTEITSLAYDSRQVQPGCFSRFRVSIRTGDVLWWTLPNAVLWPRWDHITRVRRCHYRISR